ncbi:MAG TPA: class I SAM-dependent methyltransferase [Flavisolibacter sp.]|jgi:SAM-dependent methyltransferase|nr:class I SAM-dependent methyltransferase [Flavisolibacter sp.]
MISKEFNTSLFHPYYFIRSQLLKSVQEQAHHLKGRLLDFGCGSKPYKNLLEVDEYIGVDFVNEGHPHDNEQIDVYYDGKTIPFPDNSFDSILSSEVFEHVFNLPEILKELERVLKPGGKILITCPFVWKEHELPHDYARYTLFALEDMLQKNNFTIRVINKSGNFIQVISQLVVLYFYDTGYSKVKKLPVIKQIFESVFFFLPNLFGIVLNKILPSKSQLYFNNIVVAEKR